MNCFTTLCVAIAISEAPIQERFSGYDWVHRPVLTGLVANPVIPTPRPAYKYHEKSTQKPRQVVLAYAAPRIPSKAQKAIRGLISKDHKGLARYVKGIWPNANVFSTRRSTKRQASLFKAAVKKYGTKKAARRFVAMPNTSLHEKGRAIDFKVSGVSPSRIKRKLRALKFRGGIGCYRGHIHIDTGRNRNWGIC